MTLEMSFRYKVRKDFLFQGWSLTIRQPLCCSKVLCKRFRHHQIADAYGWKQAFRKRSHVKHMARWIQALNCRDGPSVISIFTIIIVFQNVGPIFTRPGQQSESSTGGHHCTCWKLM